MTIVSGSQIATSIWMTISSLTIDTSIYGENRITYFFQNSSVNYVEVQVQASLNNSAWITLNTRDLNPVDVQGETITVQPNGSAVAIISPEDQNGINCGFQFYRVQISGPNPCGSLSVWGFAKI